MIRRNTGLFRRKSPKRNSKKVIEGLKEEFYLPHIEQAKKICENCGEAIPYTSEWQAIAAQCHILPKDGTPSFPEVAKEFFNCWEGCLICHNNYDHLPASKVAKMPVIPILRKRLKIFIHKVNPENLRRIPKYLTDDD